MIWNTRRRSTTSSLCGIKFSRACSCPYTPWANFISVISLLLYCTVHVYHCICPFVYFQRTSIPAFLQIRLKHCEYPAFVVTSFVCIGFELFEELSAPVEIFSQTCRLHLHGISIFYLMWVLGTKTFNVMSYSTSSFTDIYPDGSSSI